ncbi:MAG: hypothetical protein NZ953_00700 [Thaumarchaeota archaeon]|nr:hypothetical protein [Candidatus Calditenuaceae archaeon]MDW8043960.1 hypothetical protein [Nitrososphaerota archaeon]
MGKVVVRTPRLRGALEAADLCMLMEHSVLLLEVTEEAQAALTAYLRSGDESVLEEVSETAKLTIRSQLEFLRALRRLGYRGEVIGVMPDEAAEADYELGVEAVRLTLRYKLTGKVDVEEWLGLIDRYATASEVITHRRVLDELAEGWRGWLLVTSPSSYFDLVRSVAFEEVRYAGFPAAHAPLVQILRLRKLGRLTPRDLRRLVSEQAEFAEVVMASRSVEEAHERWTVRKLGSWAQSDKRLLTR